MGIITTAGEGRGAVWKLGDRTGTCFRLRATLRVLEHWRKLRCAREFSHTQAPSPPSLRPLSRVRRRGGRDAWWRLQRGDRSHAVGAPATLALMPPRALGLCALRPLLLLAPSQLGLRRASAALSYPKAGAPWPSRWQPAPSRHVRPNTAMVRCTHAMPSPPASDTCLTGFCRDETAACCWMSPGAEPPAWLAWRRAHAANWTDRVVPVGDGDPSSRSGHGVAVGSKSNSAVRMPVSHVAGWPAWRASCGRPREHGHKRRNVQGPFAGIRGGKRKERHILHARFLAYVASVASRLTMLESMHEARFRRSPTGQSIPRAV